jgi:hypothetical protein
MHAVVLTLSVYLEMQCTLCSTTTTCVSVCLPMKASTHKTAQHLDSEQRVDTWHVELAQQLVFAAHLLDQSSARFHKHVRL